MKLVLIFMVLVAFRRFFLLELFIRSIMTILFLFFVVILFIRFLLMENQFLH